MRKIVNPRGAISVDASDHNFCNVFYPILTIEKWRIVTMQSANNHNHPTHLNRRDYDFAALRKSSTLVLLAPQGARIDGVSTAATQIAAAEDTLSGRMSGCVEKDSMLIQSGPVENLRGSDDDREDVAGPPAFVYRATLFDSVMDFLDRYDRTAARRQSHRSEE